MAVKTMNENDENFERMESPMRKFYCRPNLP